MTREEAKSLLPIIQAFSEGKVIQYQTNGKWRDYTSTELAFDMVPIDKNYRIKPSPKYRPFKDAEECCSEMLKHQPIGFVKYQRDFFQIIHIDDKSIGYGSACGVIMHGKFDDILKCFTFADGAPFGVKVEE